MFKAGCVLYSRCANATVQVGFLQQPQNKRDLTLEETRALVKDCFTVAGERDIYTGDSAQIVTITKAGTSWEDFPLKKD